MKIERERKIAQIDALDPNTNSAQLEKIVEDLDDWSAVLGDLWDTLKIQKKKRE